MTNSYSQLMTFQILLSSPMGKRSIRVGAIVGDLLMSYADNGLPNKNRDLSQGEMPLYTDVSSHETID